MTLYLFRHAAVEQKYQGCYNGHIDINASKEGLKEAKENFETIKSVHFDAIFSSTLKRAKQTIESLGIIDNVIYSDIIREKSWGRHEGKNYDEVVAMESQSYENFYQWMEVMDGEDYQDFIDDIGDFLRKLSEESYENVLLMTHAGVIYVLVHLILGKSLEEAFNINISYGNYCKIKVKSEKNS